MKTLMQFLESANSDGMKLPQSNIVFNRFNDLSKRNVIITINGHKLSLAFSKDTFKESYSAIYAASTEDIMTMNKLDLIAFRNDIVNLIIKKTTVKWFNEKPLSKPYEAHLTSSDLANIPTSKMSRHDMMQELQVANYLLDNGKGNAHIAIYANELEKKLGI